MWALIESVIPRRRTPEIWKVRFSTLQHFNHMLQQSKPLVRDKLISWGAECRDTNKGCVLSMKCHRIFQKERACDVTHWGDRHSPVKKDWGPIRQREQRAPCRGTGDSSSHQKSSRYSESPSIPGRVCERMHEDVMSCKVFLAVVHLAKKFTTNRSFWAVTRHEGNSFVQLKCWRWQVTILRRDFPAVRGYKRLSSGLGTEWQGTNLRQDMEAQEQCQRKGWRMINKLDARQTALLMVPFFFFFFFYVGEATEMHNIWRKPLEWNLVEWESGE